MENLQITWMTLLAFFGALSVIAGGVKVIIQMFSPFKSLRDRVAKVESRVDKHDELLHNDKGAIDDLKQMSRDNLRVNITLLNHFIEGNGIDKMKTLRDDLQNKLFEVE